jgi:hypothetical protein
LQLERAQRLKESRLCRRGRSIRGGVTAGIVVVDVVKSGFP